MNSKRKALVLAVTALGALSTVTVAALATTGSGFKERAVFARGTLAPQFKIELRASSRPGDVVVQKFVSLRVAKAAGNFIPAPRRS